MHRDLTESTGGSPGILNEGALQSALAAPLQTFEGEELYPTLEEKAAKLAYFLISNHAFVDGNKRIGLYAMLVFLELNHCPLEFSQVELVDLGWGIASGKYKEPDILDFILSHKKVTL